ncbi:MAG: MFS transporter [Planctomycetes bacterium]|nr:MFS transporter [Planctomycetota bacterium]
MVSQEHAAPAEVAPRSITAPAAAATATTLILLVCCAHAMAHFFELSFPSVEPLAARDYGVGTVATGWLIFCFRMPWGFGALAAGALVDRYGAARMLAAYLWAGGLCCILIGLAAPLPALFVLMFAMGAAASIYHPAGLALISHVTTPENRGRALGMHGVFGSVGIGAAPLLAWAAISSGFSWERYFWMLAVPAAILGALFVLYSLRNGDPGHAARTAAPGKTEDAADWLSFAGLSTIGVLQGMVYAGALSFLVRYLSEVNVTDSLRAAGNVDQAALWTSGVLFVGCIGQYFAGRIAHPAKLERQLTVVTLLNAPCLAAMAFAEGWGRVAAAGTFALVHFMYQPLYNSLVSKYTPRRRRSFGYGMSFTMTFGLGGFGAALAGYLAEDWQKYGALAALSTLAAICGVWLWRRNGQSEPRVRHA